MSLVIARKISGRIVLLADTRITDEIAKKAFAPTKGVAKIRFLDEKIAVAFVGNVHTASIAFASLPATTKIFSEILGHFKKHCSSNDYILCSCESGQIFEIKDSKCQEIESSWIGSSEAYYVLRSFELGEKTPTQGRVDTFNTRILRIPKDLTTASEVFYNLFTAFGNTIGDVSIPEVGDILIIAAQEEGRFKFVNYSDSITHPIDFSSTPSNFIIPISTVEEGGFTFEFLHTDSVDAAAAYFLQGNFGIFFPTTGDFSDSIVIKEVSPAAFMYEIQKRFGIEFKSGYEHPDQYLTMGKYAFDKGHFPTAIDLFTKGIEGLLTLKDDPSSSYNRRGIAYAKTGNMVKALEDFNEAIRINPNWAWFYDCRAVLKYHLGDLSAATTDFTQAIKLEPHEASYLEKRADCLLKVGNIKAAENDLTAAKNLRSNL